MQAALLWTKDQNKHHCSSAPNYQPGQEVWLSTKHISLSPLCPPSDPPLPAWVIDSEPANMMRCIMDARCHGRGLQYLVDWEGYGLEERSWFLWSAILDRRMVRDFNFWHPDKETWNLCFVSKPEREVLVRDQVEDQPLSELLMTVCSESVDQSKLEPSLTALPNSTENTCTVYHCK